MTATRTSAARRELRFDAGSLALNLTATLGRRGGGSDGTIERLAQPDNVTRWCAGVGVGLAGHVDLGEALDELRTLREQIYEVASRVRSGTAVETGTLDDLNRRAEHPVPTPRFVLTPSASRAPANVEEPNLDLPQLLSTIVRDLMDLVVRDERRSRLRECEGEDCRMLFELPPGARERRWCSMSRCGNRAKAAKHRAHTAGSGASQ